LAAVRVPLIASGGVGTLEHFVAGASGIGEKVQRGALNGVRKIP